MTQATPPAPPQQTPQQTTDAQTPLRIDRLGRRGDGVALTPQGARVLVPLTLPGEEVTGHITDGRMPAPRIVTPSPQRIRPACPHYRSCGGCQLMHGTDDFVAGWKAGVIDTALAAQGVRIAGQAARVAAVHGSPPRSRRRAVLSLKRTKKGALAGFHARASGVIVDLADCLVLHPRITATLPALRRMAVMAGSRQGEMSVTINHGPAGLDLAVSGGKPGTPDLLAALADLAREQDWARLVWGDTPLTRRPPVQVFGDAQVVPPPGAFLQATPQGEAALLDRVRRAIGNATRVVDLFAGCGTFSLPLAAQATVHAVEGLAAPLAALDAGWRQASGLHRVTTETRNLARRPLLPDELARFDAIVIDPPRTGAEAQARQIAASDLRRLAWVSCDPVSFARDSRILLDGGWQMDWVEAVDQFRWSAHIETVAAFRRP